MLDSLDRDFVLTLEFQLLYRPDDLSLQGFSRCWSNSPHHHPPRSLPARCLIEKAFVPHHWLVTLAVRTDFLSERRNFQCGMNGGKRLRGHCPHPRAQGALALSLDRERDLERQGEGKRSTQTLVSARWPTTISSIPEVPQWQYQKFLNGTPEVPSRRVVSSSAAQFL